MKLISKALVSIFIVAFVFSPSLSFNNFVYSEEEDPIDTLFEDSDYAEITADTEINHYLDIPSYATLVVRKGVTLTFNGGSIGVSGRIFLKGTVKKPIIVKKASGAPSYSISTRGNGVIEMMNVDVSGGGSNEAPPIIIGKKSLWNNALAFGLEGAISVWGGKLITEGCRFHDNEIAVAFGQYNSETKVNRSKFSHNSVYDVLSGAPDKFNLKYNWWGSEQGPNLEKISGNIDSSGWTGKEYFHDPVVLVPGILGSQKEGDEWKMDPIFHTYDGLQKTFEENGYVLGKDLFVFPYEWRDSNVDNALKLKDKITDIKVIANWPKVDIVAHSMGGILTREYIKSNDYQNDIDQLVTLGTPQKGSPEDYLTWEAGELGIGKEAFVLEEIFKQEAKENGYSSIFEYVRKRPIASVEQLLPNYDYLYSVSDNAMRTYPNFYPASSFLDDLNSRNKLKKLENVEFTNIYGNLDDEKSTVTSLRVGKPSLDPDSIWAHGMPENYDSMTGDHGFEKGRGDGTVPIESATGVWSDETIEKKNIAHRDLPEKAADSAFEVITGIPPSYRVDYPGSDKVLIIFVFSPVDIQVVYETDDTIGTVQRVGKNFETNSVINEIPGAYYSGFHTNSEFITIPNPKSGKYKILTQGTGKGQYKIETINILEDPTTNEVQESLVEIDGVTIAGQMDEKVITLENDVVTNEDKDLIPPLISVTSPESGKIYPNNKVVDINFSVYDNKTAPDEIKTQVFFDGNKISDGQIDLSWQNIGQHIVKITAQDEIGNYSENEVSFRNIASIDSVISNVSHYRELGLISKESDKKLLLVQLNIMGSYYDFLNVVKNDKGMDAKTKTALTKAIVSIINLEADLIVSQLKNKNNYKSIDQKVKTLLIEDIKSLKIAN
jgi:hypothetical protein